MLLGKESLEQHYCTLLGRMFNCAFVFLCENLEPSNTQHHPDATVYLCSQTYIHISATHNQILQRRSTDENLSGHCNTHLSFKQALRSTYI